MSDAESTTVATQIVSDAGQPHEIEEQNLDESKFSVASVALSLNNAAPRSGLDQYLVYKPNTPNARVWSGRRTIFSYPGDEAMYAAINRYIVAINWVERMSWKNVTDGTQTYTHSITSGLTITQGSEVNQGFNLGASYEGMTIGYNYSQRTFKTTETTSSRTITIAINIPPRSTLILYQKRYDFRDEINFICDAWGREWNIGPWGGYTPLVQKNTAVQIMAEDYITEIKALPNGPGSFSTNYVGPAQLTDVTRKRENVTQRSKNVLAAMGL